jgi:hypothetical protein
MGAELVGRLLGLVTGSLLPVAAAAVVVVVAVLGVSIGRVAMGAALGAGFLAGERRIRLGLSQV